jgi:hypothetical protein
MGIFAIGIEHPLDMTVQRFAGAFEGVQRQAPGGRWRGTSHEDGRRIPRAGSGTAGAAVEIKRAQVRTFAARSPFGMMFASSVASCLGAHMGEVVRFIPKSDLDRVRLIREARAIYERIFPPADPVREQRDAPKE